MAERAGYTVTMFLIDVSPSMGKMREVELPLPNGETETIAMTNLEWSLQYVKLKIQEMIYNGRKTDQCGVILFGTEETNNIVNSKNGGYDRVSEYIPIAQPNASTLAKLSELQPQTEIGDPIDALIVGIETQDQYLAAKKKWKRRIVLLTDGENHIEVEDWEATAQKMNELSVRLIIVGVDFDDEEFGFVEEDKSEIKRTNEEFFHMFVKKLDLGDVGNCGFALEEISRPEAKETKSALLVTELRLGDVEDRPDEAVKINVKTAKCTALARPKSWKKFGRLQKEDEDVIMHDTEEEQKAIFAQLSMHTEYCVDYSAEDEEEEELTEAQKEKQQVAVEKEKLVRGYKYGASYAPCPDGNFPRLETKKGIDFCGFFPKKHFRRELSMGEVQYIWADPDYPLQQVALSSIVHAMFEAGMMAIARWVSRDGMDPKMGVLHPTIFDGADCFLWVQMPFADDVRKYTFPSLDRLVNKKGEVVTKHPYLPTEEQMFAMRDFVDALDLMEAGEKDENGTRSPWYDTCQSYNPAIHRTKQAQFHAAVVTDLKRQPLPPPHPELLKFFNPPKKMVKHAHDAIEAARKAFNVREVPKRVIRTRKDGHVRARDEDEDLLLLENVPNKRQRLSPPAKSSTSASQMSVKASQKAEESDSETEAESEGEELMLESKRKPSPKDEDKDEDEEVLPTPERSVSPSTGREPGRIVGLDTPLDDFRKNLGPGDLVSKAVEDLGHVIKRIVVSRRAKERTEEMLTCIQELRRIATKEDEIDAWNTFLQDLKRVCLEEEPGNAEFWTRVTELGRGISLISDSEADQLGGNSQISEARSRAFIRKP